MAIVRILVDGYSLLAPMAGAGSRSQRFSAAARDALIRKLTAYRDASQTPITIVFDGAGAPPGTPKPHSNPDVEVLYSPAGITADQMIERAAFRLKAYGDVLVVTDDHAERDTVINFGGFAASCTSFISQVEAAVGELSTDLKNYNRREQERFRRRS